MSKELVVSLNGREKKIAIIEDDVVTEFYVERGDENQGIVGNIYKGKVMKVLPGMQSAFVDIGLERDAFLYVSDFIDDEEFEGAFDDRKEKEARPVVTPGKPVQKTERQERPRTPRVPTTVTAPKYNELELSEAEQDEAQTLEALSHIEEIGEEPVIEHADDDEPTKKDIVPQPQDNFDQRRSKRLRFVPPPEKIKEVEKVEAVKEVEKVEEPEAVVEAEQPTEAPVIAEVEEEEFSGRGRRRRTPRGGAKRGAKAETVDALDVSSEIFEAPTENVVDAEPEATAPVEKKASRSNFDPTLLENVGEQMERIADDDLPIKPSRRAPRAEKAITKKLQVAPTPEVLVGSLAADVVTASDFEKVSDDEGLETSSRQLSASAAAIEAEASAPLEDASAEVRDNSSSSEFATRRGGRGRRRRPSGEGDGTTNQQDSVEEAAEEKEPEEKEEPKDTFLTSRGGHSGPRPSRPIISDMLREGQEVIVQIAKEPIGQKGARITSHVVLPGRYVVYMPTVEHIGVSRKIANDEERRRLKIVLNQLRIEANIPGGFIVRTAAAGRTNEELRDDVQYLGRTWTDMRKRADRTKAPTVVHRDLDLVQRILRDQLSTDFTAIRVDNELEYERIVDFVHRFAPKLIHRVKLYTKDTPILEEYGVQAEVDKAVKPRVWLKSGGYIVINQTEALVAIDVNTGKFVGRSNRLEDTIVKTNLEAAKEIARQIRLRDLGGIIILDFIDMEERRNKQRVRQALEQDMRNDKAPFKTLEFNDFGLVAITRKRVKQSLERTLCEPCQYCGGGGMVKSPQTICYELLAETRRVAKHQDNPSEVILRVNPEVAKALRSTEREIFADIESHFTGVVTIKSDPAVHQEQFDIALV